MRDGVHASDVDLVARSGRRSAIELNALASWVTDGTVKSVLAVGHRVYIGGSFHYVGPVTGSGAPLDRQSGSVVAKFPKVDGDVTASVPDGAGGYYVGGWLAVGGLRRRGLAHVKADGTVDRRWPGTNSYVYALARSGSTLYLGGDFSRVGGVVRRGVAAVSTGSRKVTDWNPGLDGEVRALVVLGSTVYMGGTFGSVGHKPRSGLAAVDAHTGAVTAWNPSPTASGARVFALAASGSTIYAGGLEYVGEEPRAYVASLTRATATVPSGRSTAAQPGSATTSTH